MLWMLSRIVRNVTTFVARIQQRLHLTNEEPPIISPFPLDASPEPLPIVPPPSHSTNLPSHWEWEPIPIIIMDPNNRLEPAHQPGRWVRQETPLPTVVTTDIIERPPNPTPQQSMHQLLTPLSPTPPPRYRATPSPRPPSYATQPDTSGRPSPALTGTTLVTTSST